MLFRSTLACGFVAGAGGHALASAATGTGYTPRHWPHLPVILLGLQADRMLQGAWAAVGRRLRGEDAA